MSDPVAILLDDAMPPERLGELLRAARKRRGWSRKHAAEKAGTTPARLRAYERGEKTIPAELCADLAACYGEDLLAHVPARTSELVDDALDGAGAGDVIATYAQLVQRARRARPGQPIELRASDVSAIGAAVGLDPAELEARIATALGCTRAEARTWHHELLRRRVVLPVAGLAAGVAAFGGIAYGAGGDVAPTPTSASAPGPTAPVVHIAHAVASRFASSSTTTTPTTALARPHPTIVVPVPKPAPPEPVTDATIVPADAEPATTTTVAADPPVSILPGETPITIVGPPDT